MRNAHRILTGNSWGNLHLENRYEDGRWMELAQDRVEWQIFISAVLNLDRFCYRES
jgi:hypothetical protein